jgi:hypothetical protein
MATPEELAAAYAASWTERDAAKRTALLDSCCSPGIRFLQEADDEVVGVEALSAVIGAFRPAGPRASTCGSS